MMNWSLLAVIVRAALKAKKNQHWYLFCF